MLKFGETMLKSMERTADGDKLTPNLKIFVH